MAKYESLLLGGAKPKRKVSQATLDALAKGRATRAKNLAAGKKQCGKGQYNQDYVDESQINYRGSPLDMYYLASPEDLAKERKERGEIGAGTRRGAGIEQELTSKAGGKLKKQKLRKPSESDVEEEDELEYTGGKMRRKSSAPSGRVESARQFMEHSLHTGMDMPTDAQIKRGGKVKKAVSKKKVKIEDLEGGALNIDVPDAIRVLGELASKFGLKLAK